MISPQQIQERRRDESLRRQLGPQLLNAVADDNITDIIVNENGQVFYDAHGKGLYAAGFWLPESQRESLIGTVAAMLGQVADAEHPIVEGELLIGGIRFEGLMPPVVRHACLAMRKPAHILYNLANYITASIITAAQAEVLRNAITRRDNILIAGATGSGKTTFGGALINEMVEQADPNERYVIIEDTLEIQCCAQNLVQLHTSENIDLTRLVRATMRLRPDRIIIGEVRGGEALALLKAWLTGHPGGITTIHANNAKSSLTRLSSLVQEAGVPPQPELIAETIQLIAFITRTAKGRRVTELVRVEGYDPREGFKLTSLGE